MPNNISPRLDASISLRNVYLHIPYCETKCPWCYIPIRIGDKKKAKRYFQSLKEQILAFDTGRLPVDLECTSIARVYLGGGTANLLEPGEITELLALLRERGLAPASALVTLEVLPSWLNAAPFEEVLQGGVNRISVAAQSLHDERLKKLSRTHSASDCVRTIQAARNAGFSQVTAEFMWGYEDAELHEMAQDFQWAIDAGVTELTSQWFNTMPNGTPPDPRDRNRLQEMYQAAKDVALASDFSNPSVQVFNRSSREAPPNGNNGAGIAQTEHGGILGFGWGAKSYVGEYLGTQPGSLEAFLQDANQPQSYEKIDSMNIELGVMLYQLTAYRSFNAGEFLSFFGYEQLHQNETVFSWLTELESARLIKVAEADMYEITVAGEALLDLYMAWLGLNNRGGIRT